MLQEHIEKDDVIRIISHNDADGISSAAVLANALAEEDVQFHTTIIPRLKEDIVNQLRHEKYDLFIFSDMGSSFIKEFNTYKHDVIVADHHQPDDTEAESNVVHLNPHLFGIDGSKDLCGAGSSYLTIREMDKKHLAYFALIGAFGDMQGQNGFTGVNKLIVQDALESGTLEIHEGLKTVSQASEPIYKSLAYTFSPPLPKISGDFDGAREFLERMNLSYGIKFTDLEDEEKDLLKEALVSINNSTNGNKTFFLTISNAGTITTASSGDIDGEFNSSTCDVTVARYGTMYWIGAKVKSILKVVSYSVTINGTVSNDAEGFYIAGIASW